MSVKHGLLVVEGPTDQAVLRRILRKLLGFEEFTGGLNELDTFWRDVAKVVPTYPPKKGPLGERLAMPAILTNERWSVAVYGGGGSRLVDQVNALIQNHDLQDKLDAFAVIADADHAAPSKVGEHYRRAFEEHFPALPQTSGEVALGPPVTGIFVLPDNRQQGVVEHLVLECGEIAYADHLARARQYVNDFGPKDRRAAKWRPFDEEKAIVASVASLLKPGKTNAVSLGDNEWISEASRERPMLRGLLGFLAALFGIDGTTKGTVASGEPA